MEMSKRERVIYLAVVPVGCALVGVIGGLVVGQSDGDGNYRLGLSPSYLLLAALLIFTLIFGLLATLLDDEKKRDAASYGFGGGMIVFVLAAFAVGLSHLPQNESLTNGEIIVLTGAAESRGDVEAAIRYLQMLRARSIGEEEERVVEGRIARLQQAQLNQVRGAN